MSALPTVQTVLTLVISAGASAAVVGAVWKRALRGLAHSIRRVEESTEQLRHNGGSHVADYARDARNLSQETLERVARIERSVDRSAERSRTAVDAARKARREVSELRTRVDEIDRRSV